MRRRRPNEGWPPGDGWAVLRPGEWVCSHEDTPFSPTLSELQIGVHRLRGGILADAFGLENEMILLRLANEFGANDATVAGPAYQDRENEYRARAGFGTLAQATKSIIRSKLSKVDADILIQDLMSVKQLRDMFAHYPCWMEPVNDASINRTIGLRAFISDKTNVYELNKMQLDLWSDVSSKARRGVENLRRSIIGAPPLNADGSASMSP